jgi:hypothetical protein
MKVNSKAERFSEESLSSEDLCFLVVPVKTYRQLERAAAQRNQTVAQMLQLVVKRILEEKNDGL